MYLMDSGQVQYSTVQQQLSATFPRNHHKKHFWETLGSPANCPAVEPPEPGDGVVLIKPSRVRSSGIEMKQNKKQSSCLKGSEGHFTNIKHPTQTP